MTSAAALSGFRGRLAERAWFSDTRSWLWHVYHRLLGRFARYPMPWRRAVTGLRLPQFGTPVYVRLGTADIITLRTLVIEGEYDELCRRKAELGPVRTIVDLGANVGLSIRIWQREFPGARIIGVEPDAANLRVAQENVRAAHAAGQVVDLVRAAAVGTSRSVYLETEGLDPLGFFARDTKAGEAGNVDGLSVDDLCARHGLADTEIDLLKCDIEGGEVELMRTPGAWLKRVRNLLIELHLPYTRADLEQDLARAGVAFDFEVLKDVGGYVTLLGRRRG
jgi:FkbM family methyltransferase